MKKEKEIHLCDHTCLQCIKSIRGTPDIEDNTKLIHIGNPAQKSLFSICSRSNATLASPNILRILKGGAIHLLDMVLETIDALENQPGGH